MLNGKAIIILLTVGLIKKRYHVIKWVIFLNHILSKNKIKVELDLSNYVTQFDFKKRNRCWYIKFC